MSNLVHGRTQETTSTQMLHLSSDDRRRTPRAILIKFALISWCRPSSPARRDRGYASQFWGFNYCRPVRRLRIFCVHSDLSSDGVSILGYDLHEEKATLREPCFYEYEFTRTKKAFAHTCKSHATTRYINSLSPSHMSPDGDQNKLLGGMPILRIFRKVSEK
jgi:hypothetical protein